MPERELFVLLGEHTSLRMTEEQSAQHVAGGALDGHRKIAAHR